MPLGKTNFDNVVQMVTNRVAQMKKSHLMLLWHHALLEAYKYLVYTRL